MKCLIVYFSQSGNTQRMARAIHSGIAPVVDLCDITSFSNIDMNELSGYDLIGVGSPCWDGVPFHIERILRDMPPQPGRQTFTFCTHGVMGFRFLPNMVKLLNEKGMVVIGSRDWYCSVSHPLIPKPYLTDGHPDATDLEEAAQFGRDMVHTSTLIKQGDSSLIPPIPPMPAPRTLSRPLSPKHINLAKCLYPKCRLCIDNCRLKIIDLSVSPPVFPSECLPCYFCEFICPTGAIETDYAPAAKIEGERAKTMFKDTLKRVEEEGHFRRLVAVEDVGWDTPYYIANNSHPRCVPIDKD